MRSLLLLCGALLLIICLPLFFTALHDAKVDEFSQTYAEISTGAGVTSANVTLSEDLWNSAIPSVLSASSNISGDSPSASAYNEVSRILTVGGLKSSSIRTIEVNYEIETTREDAASLGVFLTIIAFIMILSIIGLFARAIYEFFT